MVLGEYVSYMSLDSLAGACKKELLFLVVVNIEHAERQTGKFLVV